jgi:4-alpha-glucanotransferase
MKVLGFAFDSREPSDYLPYTYTSNTVCYTGTHDNMTTRQWFDTAADDAVKYAVEYMRLTEEEGYVWGMIRTAMSSNAKWSVVPMQDFLDLGAEARMNFPGTTGCNWTWRMEADALRPDLSKKIYNLTKLYGRIQER